MKNVDLASSLSEYAISINPKNLPNEVIQEAKRRFIDTIGCAIGAFDAKPVKISKKVAERVSSNYSATIFGTNIKTSVDLATFVNGAMIRYLDYNDTYLSKDPGHPSDNLSAVIAVGEAEESTGLDIITASVVAYEIQCRLCDALAIRVKGWDHVIHGSVSSSLAVAKLMGLSIEKAAHALSLSLIASIAMRQTRSGQISMWKACAFSNAARNAVFACMLAREGMTGPAPIFEGEEGFFKLISGPISMNIEEFGGRGGKFKILETSIKYYPSEYHSQSAVEAAIELHKMLKGRFEEIDEVLIETFEASYKIIGSGKEKWEPKSRETADHSLPYCVSVALMGGMLNLDSFKEEKLRDPKLLSFMKKVKVIENPELTKLYPEAVPNTIKIKKKNGDILEKTIIYPKGYWKNPMSDEEIENKFKSLAQRVYSQDRINEILKVLWRLDKLTNIKELIEVLKL